MEVVISIRGEVQPKYRRRQESETYKTSLLTPLVLNCFEEDTSCFTNKHTYSEKNWS